MIKNTTNKVKNTTNGVSSITQNGDKNTQKKRFKVVHEEKRAFGRAVRYVDEITAESVEEIYGMFRESRIISVVRMKDTRLVSSSGS